MTLLLRFRRRREKKGGLSVRTEVKRMSKVQRKTCFFFVPIQQVFKLYNSFVF